MIASILLFALGFLSATILAVLIIPAVWRRAVRLTTRRIEATVPLTTNEIRAERDKLRAAFAMTVRRLELKVETLEAKSANRMVEAGEQRERARLLAEKVAEQEGALSAAEEKNAEAERNLRLREDDLQRLSARLAATERQLEARQADFDKMGRAVSDAKLDASNRLIEIAARDAKIEKLSGDIAILREESRNAARRTMDADGSRFATDEALKLEKLRTTEMNEKLEKLMALLADHEEAIEAGAREIEGLRNQLASERGEGEKLGKTLTAATERQQILQAELTQISGELETLLSGAKADQLERAIEKLGTERRQLEQKLVALTQENEKLRAGLPSNAVERSQSREDALLREQISNLAAEVVHLAGLVEGPGSAIQKALNRPAPSAVSGAVTSLGERVKALQKASAMR